MSDAGTCGCRRYSSSARELPQERPSTCGRSAPAARSHAASASAYSGMRQLSGTSEERPQPGADPPPSLIKADNGRFNQVLLN